MNHQIVQLKQEVMIGEKMKEHKSWSDYPELKKLFNRIQHHRRNCPFWKTGRPCYDCHNDTLTKIEDELGLRL